MGRSCISICGVGVSLLLACSVVACSGAGFASAPTTLTPPPSVSPVPIPMAPPPAVAEEVPPRPTEAMTWVDGCWEPSGQNWVWIRGGWLIAPADAELFRGRAEVASDGSFLWHACTWVKNGRPIGWVEPLVPAASPLSQRTIYVPPS